MSKTKQLGRGEVTPERLADAVHDLYASPAADVFAGERERVTRYIQMILAGFYVEKEMNKAARSRTSALLRLKDYNNSYGIGLQSVEVQVMGDDGPLLASCDLKHPTLGVRASGLLEGDVRRGICAFDVEEGYEEIRYLSDGFVISKEASGLFGAHRSAWHGDIIPSPQKAHVVLEVPVNSKWSETDLSAPNGIYGCEYRKFRELLPLREG